MSINILIVDDSAIVRAVIEKTIRLAGHAIGEIYMAENGKEALEILADNWIDLVLADINMPVMNGLEMVEKMCDDGLLKTIPVVIISTEGSTARIDQLMAKGVAAYIRKPFAPEALVQVLKDVVGVEG